MGFVQDANQELYEEIQNSGFVLVFREHNPAMLGKKKGNVDADLVLQAMIDYSHYDRAMLVSSDGDFYSLTRYLYDNNKLLTVLSPHRKTCSSLLRKSAKGSMVYMDNLENKLSKRKGTA